jgi:predicted transcriptional regulator
LAHQVTVQLDSYLADRLKQLAVALDCPETWLIEQAIRNFIEEQSWQVSAIGEALNAFRHNSEELVPHELVMAQLARRLQA